MSGLSSNISSSSTNSTSSSRSMVGICANMSCTTKSEKLLKCSRCLFTEYCSKDCQNTDWPQHKKVCFPSKSSDIKKNDKIERATRIVLQGEMAILCPKTKEDGLIRTPHATTCHIVTLHDPEKHIGVLAHIDDYTEPTQAILKIGALIKERYKLDLGPNFKATVMGGSEICVSKKHRELLLRILKLKKVKLQFPLLPTPRPEILFNAYDGAIQFVEKENPGLQYLQRIEYGKWNTYLDLAFSGKYGVDIPYFEIKEAGRDESNIPELPNSIKVMDNSTAQRLLDSKTIFVQTLWQRTEVQTSIRPCACEQCKPSKGM